MLDVICILKWRASKGASIYITLSKCFGKDKIEGY